MRSRLEIAIILFSWTLVAIYWIVAGKKILIHSQAADFNTYYTGALAIRNNTNPFLNATLETSHDPPGFLLSFALLTWLPRSSARLLWNCLNVLSLLVS